jgi:hypothetical protein
MEWGVNIGWIKLPFMVELWGGGGIPCISNLVGMGNFINTWFTAYEGGLYYIIWTIDWDSSRSAYIVINWTIVNWNSKYAWKVYYGTYLLLRKWDVISQSNNTELLIYYKEIKYYGNFTNVWNNVPFSAFSWIEKYTWCDDYLCCNNWRRWYS